LDANGGSEDANNNGEKSFKHVSSFSGKICCEHTAQLNLGHHITILKWQTESGCYTACHDHSPGSINQTLFFLVPYMILTALIQPSWFLLFF
jgi:hypothetical protein